MFEVAFTCVKYTLRTALYFTHYFLQHSRKIYNDVGSKLPIPQFSLYASLYTHNCKIVVFDTEGVKVILKICRMRSHPLRTRNRKILYVTRVQICHALSIAMIARQHSCWLHEYAAIILPVHEAYFRPLLHKLLYFLTVY